MQVDFVKQFCLFLTDKVVQIKMNLGTDWICETYVIISHPKGSFIAHIKCRVFFGCKSHDKVIQVDFVKHVLI